MYRWILIVLFIAGCASESPFESAEYHKSLQLEFDWYVTPMDERHDDFVVDTGPGKIIVDGFLWTSQGGYTLTEDERIFSRTVFLEVTAENTHFGITIPMHHTYNVVIGDLPSGRYNLKVMHTYPLHEKTVEIVDTVIKVP